MSHDARPKSYWSLSAPVVDDVYQPLRHLAPPAPMLADVVVGDEAAGYLQHEGDEHAHGDDAKDDDDDGLDGCHGVYLSFSLDLT